MSVGGIFSSIFGRNWNRRDDSGAAGSATPVQFGLPRPGTLLLAAPASGKTFAAQSLGSDVMCDVETLLDWGRSDSGVLHFCRKHHGPARTVAASRRAGNDEAYECCCDQLNWENTFDLQRLFMGGAVPVIMALVATGRHAVLNVVNAQNVVMVGLFAKGLQQAHQAAHGRRGDSGDAALADIFATAAAASAALTAFMANGDVSFSHSAETAALSEQPVETAAGHGAAVLLLPQGVVDGRLGERRVFAAGSFDYDHGGYSWTLGAHTLLRGMAAQFGLPLVRQPSVLDALKESCQRPASLAGRRVIRAKCPLHLLGLGESATTCIRMTLVETEPRVFALFAMQHPVDDVSDLDPSSTADGALVAVLVPREQATPYVAAPGGGEDRVAAAEHALIEARRQHLLKLGASDKLKSGRRSDKAGRSQENELLPVLHVHPLLRWRLAGTIVRAVAVVPSHFGLDDSAERGQEQEAGPALLMALDPGATPRASYRAAFLDDGSHDDTDEDSAEDEEEEEEEDSETPSDTKNEHDAAVDALQVVCVQQQPPTAHETRGLDSGGGGGGSDNTAVSDFREQWGGAAPLVRANDPSSTYFLATHHLRLPLPAGRVAVLVYYGSFAPFHAGHLETLKLAKRIVEKIDGRQVIGAYVSPSTRLRVKEAALDGLSPWSTRAAIAAHVLAHVPWAHVDDGGGAPDDIVTSMPARIASALPSSVFAHSGGVDVYWVNGGDIPITPFMHMLLQETPMRFVFVPRAAENPVASAAAADYRVVGTGETLKDAERSAVVIPPPTQSAGFLPTLAISSTQIRRAIHERQFVLAERMIGNAAAAARCFFACEEGRGRAAPADAVAAQE